MQGEEALLVVIPRDRPDQSEWLSHSLGNHSTVRVILDRRFGDRRHHAGAHDYERRNGDRRGSSEADAELATGRWVVVANASRLVNFLDADDRAILFLCCEKHVIPCQKCQDTYRLGWITRRDRGTLACPRCGTDLTAIAAAHTQGCHYWANRLAARAPTER